MKIDLKKLKENRKLLQEQEVEIKLNKDIDTALNYLQAPLQSLIKAFSSLNTYLKTAPDKDDFLVYALGEALQKASYVNNSVSDSDIELFISIVQNYAQQNKVKST